MLYVMFHRQCGVGLAVKCAGNYRDRPARHKFADENHTAPPRISGFFPNIEAQVHFLEIPMQRNWKAEQARVEKEKANNTQKRLAIFVVDFSASRNKGREQARIDDVIQHRKVTPVSSEKWLHVKILGSQPVAVESLSRANAISRSKSFRLRDRAQVASLGGENPFGPSFVFLAWRRWNFQFDELRPGWFVTDRGEERSTFAVGQ